MGKMHTVSLQDSRVLWWHPGAQWLRPATQREGEAQVDDAETGEKKPTVGSSEALRCETREELPRFTSFLLGTTLG